MSEKIKKVEICYPCCHGSDPSRIARKVQELLAESARTPPRAPRFAVDTDKPKPDK